MSRVEKLFFIISSASLLVLLMVPRVSVQEQNKLGLIGNRVSPGTNWSEAVDTDGTFSSTAESLCSLTPVEDARYVASDPGIPCPKEVETADMTPAVNPQPKQREEVI